MKTSEGERQRRKGTTIASDEIDHERHIAVEKSDDKGVGGISVDGCGGQDFEEIENSFGETVVSFAHKLKRVSNVWKMKMITQRE